MDFFDNQESNQQENTNFNEDNNNDGQFQEFNNVDNQNPQSTGFIALGGGNQGNNIGFDMPNELDEEEEKRIAARREEEAQRRRKIEEKMSLELKLKEEYRVKASEFIEDFEAKLVNSIQLLKNQNALNEENALQDKQLLKEGKKNPWEKVLENISIKESDYKGTKNVTRMRSVIVARKNDYSQQN